MYLSDKTQQFLRQIGKITNDEVATKEGDKFVAINVLNQQRRIIDIDERMLESQGKFPVDAARRVLKG